MSDIDEIDNGPINKFRAMFAEHAAHRGSDGSHIPIKGDVRVHFTGYPTQHIWGMAPIDISDLASRFVEASERASTILRGVRDFHPDFNSTDYVRSVFSKEAPDFPLDKPHKLFVDLDLDYFKEQWEMGSPDYIAAHPETVINVDMLIADRKFQLECLLADIEKVETPNVVVDLTRFKNLAIHKSQGPAQQSMDLGSPS